MMVVRISFFIGLCYIGRSLCIISCPYSTQKLAQSTAFSYVNNAGIRISSSGACADRYDPSCTSLDQINCRTVAQLVEYKEASGCNTIITGC